MDDRAQHIEAGHAAQRRTAAAVTGAIEAAGLTRNRVAELTAIPYTRFYDKCDGARAFDAEELGRIASLLGIRIAALAADEEVKA